MLLRAADTPSRRYKGSHGKGNITQCPCGQKDSEAECDKEKTGFLALPQEQWPLETQPIPLGGSPAVT
jgi:hypothetical protein